MNRPGITRWIMFGVAALAIVAAGMVLTAKVRRRPPALPPLVSHPELPELFDRALQESYAAAGAVGNRTAAVRKLARLYLANGFYQEAKACYKILAAEPAGLTARDHYHLALLARETSDSEAERESLRAVLSTEPDYMPVRLALAEILFKSGQGDEAGRVWTEILASAPGQPQATIGLARLEVLRGQADAAQARLEKLMVAHPEATTGATLLAQLLERRGEIGRAKAMKEWSRRRPEPVPEDPWQTELRDDTYDIERLALKYEEYARTGQEEMANLYLQRIEQLDPKGPVSPMLRGAAAVQAQHDGEAARYYRLALERGGDPERICPPLVRSLLALGQAREAAALMAEYFAKLPDSIPIQTAYSEVVLKLDDERLAREVLTRVLRRQPYLYAQNMRLAQILWAAGERAAAVECLQRVARTQPEDISSRALLGEYYLGRSDPDSAIGPLEEARGVAEDKAVRERLTAMLSSAYLQAGNAEASRGQWTRAIDRYDQAIAISPKSLEAYAAKAGACVQLKQFQPAAVALEKLASLQPENPTIYLSLGDVLYQNGDKAEASRHWRRALQLAATDDAALRRALGERLGGRITADTFK